MTISKTLLSYLEAAAKNYASDLHLKPDSRVYARISVNLVPMGKQVLSKAVVANMILSLLDETQKAHLLNHKELDFSLSLDTIGRLRINAYIAQGNIEAVMRFISYSPKDFNMLNLEPADSFKKLADYDDGLVIISGATGSGKSSTISAMVDYINKNKTSRIITLENPVEVVHKNIKSLISQRELGSDIHSFYDALKSALRQDVDVIVVGEIRDSDTAKIALQAAETGHLVLTTIHAINTIDTISRYLSLFNADERDFARDTFAQVLRGIVVQKLIPSDGSQDHDRVPMLEVGINTTRLARAIADNKQSDIIASLKEGGYYGMATFDESLVRLYKTGKISEDTMYKFGSSKAAIKALLG